MVERTLKFVAIEELKCTRTRASSPTRLERDQYILP
jgi:hypothetical protein